MTQTLSFLSTHFFFIYTDKIILSCDFQYIWMGCRVTWKYKISLFLLSCLINYDSQQFSERWLPRYTDLGRNLKRAYIWNLNQIFSLIACPSGPTIQTVSVKFWLCPQKIICNWLFFCQIFQVSMKKSKQLELGIRFYIVKTTSFWIWLCFQKT